MKPLVAFTSGDPGGIGPEIAVKAAADRRVRAACRPLFIGPLAAFKHAGWHRTLGPMLDISSGDNAPYPHRPDARSGQASFAAVRMAVKLAMNGKVDAIVTGPISKQAWAKAGTGFLGHTEFLRHACATPQAVMSFISGPARCALVTEHLPIVKLTAALKASLISRVCKTFSSELKKLGIKKPALCLCALNPHASDGGRIGREELHVLQPVVSALRKSGLRISGPQSADSAWRRHLAGEWDGLVCLYHDQALLPLKTAVRYAVAHWTCGLPVIRTSPTHGTAFDIAGRGKADPSSAIEAALFAARLSGRGG